jgi:modulator of FtsH protease
MHQVEAGVLTSWHDFLIAAAGASGALAGLVFVALSINLERILATTDLPGRAGETIIQLAGALVVSLLALIPDTAPSSLGWLVVAAGILVWGVPTRMQVLSLVRRTYYSRWYAVRRMLVHQIAALPLVVAGLLIATGSTRAMDWLAGALLACMVAALNNAWVLLVEIVR